MSDRVTNAEVGDDARATLRLMGSRARKTPYAHMDERLILTPQLRVRNTGVLRLTPEDAVPTDDQREPDKEPPLAKQSSSPSADLNPSRAGDARPATPGAPKADVLVLTSPIKQHAPSKPTDVKDLKAKITALETAIAKTVDQWEPDGTSNDPYAGTQPLSMTWPEDESDGTSGPLDQLVRGSATRNAVTDAVQTAVSGQVMDEKALRSIVADIVKSELQGELGDRITRNVRKLVRREIHRALTAKSFP
ncbi:hypothetical protein [Roseobacter litoralis]|uniref:hypothetical protein n=1 Tax=Roseobacter litoralis TaxID=42443 RepID=UPI002493986E|nr:hypothetical protein [Roseobacter litoralis]